MPSSPLPPSSYASSLDFSSFDDVEMDFSVDMDGWSDSELSERSTSTPFAVPDSTTGHPTLDGSEFDALADVHCPRIRHPDDIEYCGVVTFGELASDPEFAAMPMQAFLSRENNSYIFKYVF